MKKFSLFLGLLAISLIFLVGCGSKAVTMDEIPAYPEATALEPGADPVADTLVENMAQDAQIRTDVGVGGQIEQKAYRLPAGATWDDVESFYNDKLGANDWENGLGGIAGNIAGDMMGTVNQANEMMQIGTWSRDKQTLSLVRVAETTDSNGSFLLILSLATN
ncbi:MAG: hypothetical protein H6652_22215 [Ardenticatenaceae bacterium]|nr:hypothetical protein [Ardenticatenaceae bacterium]MCB8947778.1 hypothetical protein [Ardenticatenaceae bacterium]